MWTLMEKKQIHAQLVLSGAYCGSVPYHATVTMPSVQLLLCRSPMIGGDPDTNVLINRQKAIETMKEVFSFVAPSLLDLMLVRIRTLPAARGKNTHMCVLAGILPPDACVCRCRHLAMFCVQVDLAGGFPVRGN